MSKIVRLSFVGLLVLALSAVALAQSTTTGSIGGVVTNPNKEVVPGASVTSRNSETNREEAATTDDQGRFKVVNLQPGQIGTRALLVLFPCSEPDQRAALPSMVDMLREMTAEPAIVVQ